MWHLWLIAPIGQYLFENTITFNEGTYCTMRTDFFVPALHMVLMWTMFGLNRLINLSDICVWRIYLHNLPLQPFSQDYDQASHTTYVVCINFMHECCNLQFKVDSEGDIFEKLFIVILFTLQSFCQKSAERKSPKEYFHISSFWYRALHLISQHTTPTRLWRLPRIYCNQILIYCVKHLMAV